jgi:hypothetical protein
MMNTNEPLHHHYNDGKFHPDCPRCRRDRTGKVTVSYAPASGNLILTADLHEAPRLRRLGRGRPETWIAEAAFIRDHLVPQGFAQLKPEDVGALTSAPLVQNAKGEVFGFMAYQVQSFLEELIAGHSVEWQKG